jgi:uncharacterized integral membrane protein
MNFFFKTVPVFLIGVVVISLMVFNRDPVSVFFAPDTFIPNIPLYLVFFAGLFVGLLISGVLILTLKVQAQITLRRANKENIRLREQLIILEREFDKKTNAHKAAIDAPERDSLETTLAKNMG